MEALWLFIPEEAYILVLVGSAFALMFGIMTGRQVASIWLTIIALVILAPFFDSLMNVLPTWALVLIGIWCLGTLLKALMGRHIYEDVLARIIFHSMAFFFLLPFRMIGWLFGSRRR